MKRSVAPHSLTHSFSHSLTHSLTHSLAHSVTAVSEPLALSRANNKLHPSLRRRRPRARSLQTDEQTNERTDERTNERTTERTNEFVGNRLTTHTTNGASPLLRCSVARCFPHAAKAKALVHLCHTHSLHSTPLKVLPGCWLASVLSSRACSCQAPCRECNACWSFVCLS